MKKIALIGLSSALILGGVALAQQAREEKKDVPTSGMMQGMMGGEKGSEKMGTMNMMRQMGKMMDQCSAMMESMANRSGAAEEGQKK